VLGDSISTATGTGTLGGETPNNSWSTGTNPAVNSTYQRLLAINPAIAGNRANMASNGRRMVHMAEQAAAMPADTQYVEVALGGNDLCRSTVAEMTSVEDYRAQFVAGLEAIAQRAPEALISAYTVPDIFNLWYIRYAPGSYNGQQSSQAGVARTYVNLSVIPCLSLLANPSSVSEADMARRFQVRARTMAYNEVIIEECDKVLRCRHDDGATFDLSSNRGPDGEYLDRSEWRFVDTDISRNTASLCPLSGAFAPGCGDHFHPSIEGQFKLAEGAWDLGRDWSDDVAPEVTVTQPPGPGPVAIAATDSAGVRGIEHRVGPGPWTAALGDLTEVALSPGTHHLEVRAIDVNGNLSDSQVSTVTVPEPPAPSGVTGSVTASVDLAGAQAYAFGAGDIWPVAATAVQAATPTSGSFAFDDLPAGDYQFVIVPTPESQLLARWVGGDQDRAGAGTYAVAADELLTLPTTEVQAGGTISGTVTDTTGAGVSGATIAVFGPGDTWLPRATATTGPDGAYAVRAVVDGTYQVRATGPGGAGLAASWHGGASTRGAAAPVEIADATSATSVDIELAAAGSIAGTVTGPGSTGVAGVWVMAYTATDTWVGSAWAFTEADGSYQFTDLPQGSYRVRFGPPTGSGLAAEWFEDTPGRSTATELVVGPGTTLVDIDAALAPS
jgi:lysophospholipase L1-like esterase